MKKIKYLIEYIILILVFKIFRIIGYENASNLGEKIGRFFGPLFRNRKIILNNLAESNIGKNDKERNIIVKSMWGNYGRILAEYQYMEDFRNNKLEKFIKIDGLGILEEIKIKKKQVIFISGHFNNFELMAMYLEKSGIRLGAIYRPLNNIYLNKIMENIRIKFICKNQIKKGLSGTREVVNLVKNGFSIALMVDQRVSEGGKSIFFNREASTTTIPAQLVKKYNLDIVPVYIERNQKKYFKMSISKPLSFKNRSIEEITQEINFLLEKMVLKNPDQWIWSHNRWK
tara:strand:+ start:62 stop:919 length:858 start_codon:yes stop_codon:yes gene_type:complete